ncbi:MaoC/PaaZ C-terminal domain-containing protein [Geodermatophilus sp. CPCC 205506]|uniref:MaoC/PaaZ C-terminal domain-containing protein n=1 Tax=Geodermatophilus sp. CPCC 205506 TaxID=2936596 RepID=UPI003EE8F2FD
MSSVLPVGAHTDDEARAREPGPRVGDSASRSRRVRAEDIGLFTELTGDANPLHTDPALAARSRFGGVVVQGGVTSGLLNALVAEDLPGPGSVFLSVAWSFRAPGTSSPPGPR